MFKKIGVIICQPQEQYQTTLLKGILSKAFSLNYDVLVFSTFIKDFNNENYQLGERNIFSLINFDMLDGLIVAGDTLKLMEPDKILYPRLKKECKCPVVFVDYCNDLGFENIATNDTRPFEEIVDHLIDVHGCRNILFYSGPYEVSSTQTRYEGYKNSLKKHGIEPDPDFVSFDGDFWIGSGQRVAKEIIDGKRRRPDAIAFCGDHMAIAAQNEFQAAGWKIPEDIIIVGYDAINASLKCVPPMTSYTPPVDAAGENAVTVLDAKIRGVDPVNLNFFGGKLELGGSCGCPEDFTYTKRMCFQTDVTSKYEDFLHSTMMEDFAEADSFLSLLVKFGYFLYLVPGWQRFYLCLCDDWMSSSIYSEEENMLTEGYSDKMRLYIDSKPDNGRVMQEIFDVKIMLPALYEDRPEPQAFYFIPLHFNRKCLGYSVLSYGKDIKVFDINYMNWTKHICNALEYYRMQSKVSSVAFIDVLTGAYTRVGINRNINMLINHIHDDNYRFFVLVADLDNLKGINDNLGHQCGDLAIHELAKILISVTGDFELCARTGGDEFVIMGCNDYTDDHIDKLIESVLNKIETVNNSGILDFRLSASLGGVLRAISETHEIEELYHDADRNMYKMKKLHHRDAAK